MLLIECKLHRQVHAPSLYDVHPKLYCIDDSMRVEHTRVHGLMRALRRTPLPPDGSVVWKVRGVTLRRDCGTLWDSSIIFKAHVAICRHQWQPVLGVIFFRFAPIHGRMRLTSHALYVQNWEKPDYLMRVRLLQRRCVTRRRFLAQSTPEHLSLRHVTAYCAAKERCPGIPPLSVLLTTHLVPGVDEGDMVRAKHPIHENVAWAEIVQIDPFIRTPYRLRFGDEHIVWVEWSYVIWLGTRYMNPPSSRPAWNRIWLDQMYILAGP